MHTVGSGYNLKDMPCGLRPRERMEQFGVGALSDRELLAILLTTGSHSKNVLSLADEVIRYAGGLQGLNGMSMEELMETNGIGPAKATTILASLELGRRVGEKHGQYRPQIQSSQDAADLFTEHLQYLDREQFQAILLNTKNIVLGIENISVGTLNSSIVHPREVFKNAIKKNANAMILGHNHPSGDCIPSKEDYDTTRRLTDAGEIIGIRVLDHIIIGNRAYYSFKEHGDL